MNPGVEAKEAAALRTAAGAAGAGKRALRAFDGVICFGGEDWWYHNRGHFDMQMMREISAGVPVLYVNSIGMRVPRIGEGGMFFRRLLRKLRSLRRGLVRVRERFAVFTPAAAPGRLGSAVTRRILPFQVRRAARRAGIHRPLIWVACPPAAAVIDALRPAGVVYQRTDRFESFAGVDREQILACDHLLKERADTVIYCSSWLMDEEQRESPRALFVDHGVDFDRFSAAGQARGRDPEDLRDLAHPRVGFIGGIDAHTFDPPLFHEVAARLPEVRFFLVGSSSLPPRWCDLPNVRHLGRKAYEEVPRYMAAADVLIMPWNASEWIQACNPVKLKEYLAVGRPVVSTPFHELDKYLPHVRVASGPKAFAAAIQEALETPDDPESLRARVRAETWAAKAMAVIAHLEELGLVP